MDRAKAKAIFMLHGATFTVCFLHYFLLVPKSILYPELLNLANLGSWTHLLFWLNLLTFSSSSFSTWIILPSINSAHSRHTDPETYTCTPLQKGLQADLGSLKRSLVRKCEWMRQMTLPLVLQAKAELGSTELFLSWPEIYKGNRYQCSGILQKDDEYRQSSFSVSSTLIISTVQDSVKICKYFIMEKYIRNAGHSFYCWNSSIFIEWEKNGWRTSN